MKSENFFVRFTKLSNKKLKKLGEKMESVLLHKKNKTYEFLMIIIFMTNISQLPILYETNLFGNIINLLWIVFVLYLLLTFNFKFKIKLFSIKVFIIFNLLIMSMSVLNSTNYLSSNFIYPMFLSMFIMSLGQFIGQIYGVKIMKSISKIYISSAMIVASYIYVDSFLGSNWINIGYVYSAKNSLAPILLIAIVFMCFYNFTDNKFINNVSLLFMVTLIIMLKSRATILGLILLVLYITLFVIKKKNSKLIAIMSIFLFTIVIFRNSLANDFFINNILLNNKQGSDLNSISSNRVDHLEYFKTYFSEYIWMGNGGKYLESMPLAALFSYGIIGSIPIFILALYPFFVSFKYRKIKLHSEIRKIIVAICLIMLANGIFEELSPFGPGVRCYMLWLLTGIFLGLIIRENDTKGQNVFQEDI